MTQITDTIETVKVAAERVGLRELARLAEVPYTTLKSFADRDWSNKNLTVLQRLATAAQKVNADTDAAA